MSSEKELIRNLAICLWQHTDFSPGKMHSLINMPNLEAAKAFWEDVYFAGRLPSFDDACAAGREIEQAYHSAKSRILCPGDAGYPTGLYVMKHAPIVCVRGRVECLSQPQIAIVGSRQVCSAAKTITPMIADDVMCRGFIVTSGGAAGIDAMAHRQAMHRNQPTIVVSAMGTNTAYPKENEDIFEYARECGAVISQFPNRKMTFKPNFPLRNDVIAALCDATVIVQCRLKSGALYTAKAAARFHRPILAAAMPGFDALTEGGLECIKSGMAGMLSSGRDFDKIALPHQQSFSFSVINQMPEEKSEPLPPVLLADTQVGIVDALKKGAMTRELLRDRLQFPDDFDESLLELELSGVIACCAGKYRFLH